MQAERNARWVEGGSKTVVSRKAEVGPDGLRFAALWTRPVPAATINTMATASQPNATTILISGGGIAGLTLGILLKERGWNPLVVERQAAPSRDGYMMDFFGTGWDVAERMELVDAIRAIRYPIDDLKYVDDAGRAYLDVPLDRIRRALDDRYVYLLRSDLERVLLDRAERVGVVVRYGTSIRSLTDAGDRVDVMFEDGETAAAGLVVGADGVHSRVRALALGPEESFARSLDGRVAAFSTPRAPEVGRSVVLHEEPDRLAAFYPISDARMQAMYVFRDDDAPDFVAPDDRLPLLRREFDRGGWITSRVLQDLDDRTPMFYDALTQIVMPRWSIGRVCLIGDACGCLTLVAGQGSHMAMAGAYVLATELSRRPDDHASAFAAYERFFKPLVRRKQDEAARLATRFVPSAGSWTWLRRLALRAIFNRFLLGLVMQSLGGRSVLRGYDR